MEVEWDRLISALHALFSVAFGRCLPVPTDTHEHFYDNSIFVILPKEREYLKINLDQWKCVLMLSLRSECCMSYHQVAPPVATSHQYCPLVGQQPTWWLRSGPLHFHHSLRLQLIIHCTIVQQCYPKTHSHLWRALTNWVVYHNFKIDRKWPDSYWG